MNGRDVRSDDVVAGTPGPAPSLKALGTALTQNTARNLQHWCSFIALAPRSDILRPPLPAVAATIATIAVVVAAMFLIDAAASEWTRHLPQWFEDVFERITDFGLSGWFLIPFAFVVLCLAAVISPAMPKLSQAVLTLVAARFGFLFLAIGVPGLFDTIIKRLIGRARPYVDINGDPFTYRPFVWRSEYASLPSGHATTSVAAAIAIGALWPRSRGVMWFYALTIMFSRVVVNAHHPSDVIAGALVGASGALLVRRWFAGRRLLFCPRDLRPYPGPSLWRIAMALRQAAGGLRASR